MEKRQVTFLIIAALILVTWMLLPKPSKPSRKETPQPTTEQPEPAEVDKPTEADKPTEEAPVVEGEGEPAPETAEAAEGTEEAEPAEADKPAEAGKLIEETTPFEPALHALSNPYATFEISTKGGVVRQVVMETKQTSKGEGIVIHGDTKYAFCADGLQQKMYPLAIYAEKEGGLDLAEVEFKKVEAESDDRTLVLRYENPRLAVTKTFTLPEDGYRLEVDLTIRNTSGTPLKLPEYYVQVGSVHPIEEKDRREARITVSSGSAKKLTPARGEKSPRDYPFTVLCWAAISNKYFAAILDARGPEGTGEIKARQVVSETELLAEVGKKKTKVYATSLSVKLPDLPLGADEERVFHLALYVGPKEYSRLRPLGYSKVMGTTFIATFAAALMYVLSFIYTFIPNYGVAIILLTACIKLLLFPLDRRSFRSMKEMQRIQPLIKELQKKYKDDKAQLQKEQMKLFKEHKVNPLGGCFPILLQFPVLYGMFTMLRNAVELWRAPFAGYINDLSQPDTLFTIAGFPIHVLPVLMTVFTILSQRLRGQTQATDPQQKMMANMMPIVFLFIFYGFAAGLNLYWLCSTVFSFGVQLAIQKSDDKKENKPHERARTR